MAYVADQIPVTIRRRLFFRTQDISSTPESVKIVPRGSFSFVGDAVPGVAFQLFFGLSGKNSFAVDISKRPSNSAKATISILKDKFEIKAMEVDDWTNHCEIDNIPITIHDISFSTLGHTLYECEIKWYGYLKKVPIINLYHDVKRLLNIQKFSDFTIAVNNEEIPVHKVILAAQSPVFSTMLDTDMKESTDNRMIVTDIEIEIVRKVIEFLYTGEIDIGLDVETIISILSVADRYQIMALKNLCVEVLSMKMTLDNVLHILEAADLYQVLKLVDGAIIFMINNKREIIRLDDIENFGCKHPKLMIKYMIRVIELCE